LVSLRPVVQNASRPEVRPNVNLGRQCSGTLSYGLPGRVRQIRTLFEAPAHSYPLRVRANFSIASHVASLLGTSETRSELVGMRSVIAPHLLFSGPPAPCLSWRPVQFTQPPCDLCQTSSTTLRKSSGRDDLVGLKGMFDCETCDMAVSKRSHNFCSRWSRSRPDRSHFCLHSS